MDLKELHVDTAIVWIEKRRELGKSNQDIYLELTQVYKGKEEIAKLVAHTLTTEQKNQFRTLNNILFIILSLSGIFKIGFGIALATNSLDYLFATVSSIINFGFAYGVYKYSISSYMLFVKIIVVSWIRFVLMAQNPENINPTIVTIDIVFSVVVVFMLFYISTESSSLQQHEFIKDENGEYIID